MDFYSVASSRPFTHSQISWLLDVDLNGNSLENFNLEYQEYLTLAFVEFIRSINTSNAHGCAIEFRVM